MKWSLIQHYGRATGGGSITLQARGTLPMITLETLTDQSALLRKLGGTVANSPDQTGETIRLGVGIVRELRESVARTGQELEQGGEATSFVQSFGPMLPVADEYLVQLGKLLDELSGAEGGPGEPFVAELRLLKKEAEAFRSRLTEALALASAPPRPL